MNSLLIIDSNYLCHRAYHAMGELSFEDSPTQIIFNFLGQLLTLKEQFVDHRVVFCWDSRHSIRRSMFEGYKRGRGVDNQTDEERGRKLKAYDQFSEIRARVLPRMGFRNIFLFAGYESDDIIASVVRTFPSLMKTIVTSDNDLLQLLNSKCRIYNPQKQETMTDAMFVQKWRIQPEDWWRVKAIAGCTSDSVPGVRGVGEATAVKYLLGAVKRSSKIGGKIAEATEIIERNEHLVRLPLSLLPIKLYPDCLTPHDLATVFSDYGMRSYENNLQRWEKAFTWKQ